MRTLSSRSGFTLTELLVVIAIIGVLTAISVPAVMVARSTAQKAACANNLKDIGIAVTGYHSDKDRYPASFYTRTDGGGNNYTFNWSVAILYRMDQAVYSDELKDNPSLIANAFRFDKYICPMDDVDETGPVMSYAANMGVYDDADTSHTGHILFRDPIGKGSGIFYDRTTYRSGTSWPPVPPSVTMRADDVSDGLSQTILVSDRANPETSVGSGTAGFTQPHWNDDEEKDVGLVWRSDRGVDEFALPYADYGAREYVGFGEFVNYDTYSAAQEEKLNAFSPTAIDFARPSSYHGGAVNVLFCDGSVQSVQNSIPYEIYARLMTSDGRRILDFAPSADPFPSPITPLGMGVIKDSDY